MTSYSSANTTPTRPATASTYCTFTGGETGSFKGDIFSDSVEGLQIPVQPVLVCSLAKTSTGCCSSAKVGNDTTVNSSFRELPYSIQYRMHPEISQLPSSQFYQKRLLDGPDMASKTAKPWHSHPKFGPYRFFNVHRGQEQGTPGNSLKNRPEAQVAVALYARLYKEFGATNLDFRVGVVSMYRGQVNELRRTFETRFGEDIRGKIHFNTVDGFQGQEKDIIILSCVRAGPGLQSVGFLAGMLYFPCKYTLANYPIQMFEE